MKDKDVEIEKIRASVEKNSILHETIRCFAKIGGFLFSLSLIFKGLKPFLSSKPEVIDAMSRIFEKINISNISGYLLCLPLYGAWRYERSGKKRAIEKKGDYQKKAESNDAYRSSSGLTELGDTPKEKIR